MNKLLLLFATILACSQNVLSLKGNSVDLVFGGGQQSNPIQSITFVPGSVVSGDSACDSSISTSYSDGVWTISLNCDRSGQNWVANEFNTATGGKSFGLWLDWNAPTPNALNFYFEVVVTLANGFSSNLFFGQGHWAGIQGSFNNWWIGGTTLVNNNYLHATVTFSDAAGHTEMQGIYADGDSDSTFSFGKPKDGSGSNAGSESEGEDDEDDGELDKIDNEVDEVQDQDIHMDDGEDDE